MMHTMEISLVATDDTNLCFTSTNDQVIDCSTSSFKNVETRGEMLQAGLKPCERKMTLVASQVKDCESTETSSNGKVEKESKQDSHDFLNPTPRPNPTPQ